MVEKQRDCAWGERELLPTLGVVRTDLAAKERRAGAQCEVQGRLAAHESNGCKQKIRIVQSEVDVDARGHNPRAVGLFNTTVIWIVRVGTLELGVVPQTEGASRQQGQSFGL